MKKWMFFVLFFLPIPCFALTNAQIISTARVYLGDQSNSPTRQQFTDATLLSFLNDGQREANSLDWLLMSTYTFTLTGGTTEYALPSDFMATQRVLYKNSKIDQTSLSELDANSIGWRNASGTPIKYYLDYFLNPFVYIGFYPAPTTLSANTVIVYYVQQTSEMTSTSQSPWNGWTILSPYHSGLAYYLAFRGYQAQGDTDMAAQFLNEWLNFLQLMKQGLYKQPDFNPGFSGRRTQ